MLTTRLCRFLSGKRLSTPALRFFHHEFTQPDPPKTKAAVKEQEVEKRLEKPITNTADTKTELGNLANKYKIFRDADATEVFDVEEERNRYQMQDEPDPQLANEYLGLNLQRGLHGVFDIEDLVEVLRKENAEDVFVCSVPKERKYVDYMVFCSGRSYRHMYAIAEFVRRMFKIKRQNGDLLPKIEGENSRDWMALDLGNIALHIFSPSTRESYDLESLWSIGSEFDKECNKPEDPIFELFEQSSISLEAPQPPTETKTISENKS